MCYSYRRTRRMTRKKMLQSCSNYIGRSSSSKEPPPSPPPAVKSFFRPIHATPLPFIARVLIKQKTNNFMHTVFKVFEDDEVSKTTVEAHMAQAQVLDSAKFITAGMIEVFSDSDRAAAPPDKISAHLLRRGRSSVSFCRSVPPCRSTRRWRGFSRTTAGVYGLQ